MTPCDQASTPLLPVNLLVRGPGAASVDGSSALGGGAFGGAAHEWDAIVARRRRRSSVSRAIDDVIPASPAPMEVGRES